MAKRQPSKEELAKIIARRTFITATVTTVAGIGLAGLGIHLTSKQDESPLETIVEQQQIQGPQIGPQTATEIDRIVAAVNDYYSKLDNSHSQLKDIVLWNAIAEIYGLKLTAPIDPTPIHSKMSESLGSQGYFFRIKGELAQGIVYNSFILAKLHSDTITKLTLSVDGKEKKYDSVVVEQPILVPYSIKKNQDDVFFLEDESLIVVNHADLQDKMKVSFSNYQRIRQGAEIKTLDDIEAYMLAQDLETDFNSEEEFKEAYYTQLTLSTIVIRGVTNTLLDTLDGTQLTTSQEIASRVLGNLLAQSKSILSTGLPFYHYLGLISSQEFRAMNKENALPLTDDGVQEFFEKNLRYLTKQELRHRAEQTIADFGSNPEQGYRREVLNH